MTMPALMKILGLGFKEAMNLPRFKRGDEVHCNTSQIVYTVGKRYWQSGWRYDLISKTGSKAFAGIKERCLTKVLIYEKVGNEETQ